MNYAKPQILGDVDCMTAIASGSTKPNSFLVDLLTFYSRQTPNAYEADE